MADKDQDQMLREMALHRGFRLVKSRRRKPGTGDYGKFGLTDAKTGAPCFGVGKRGLTASAEEIESYLRSSEIATWKRSVASSGAGPKVKAKEKQPKAVPPRAARRSAKAEVRKQPASSPPWPKPEPAPRPRPKPEPKQAPPPEPELRIRKAAKGDAESLARLLTELGEKMEAKEIVKRLVALARSKEPVLVADRGAIIGCASWHVISSLHRPPTGRLTMIVVARDARRQGIGRALMEAAEAAMKARGCGLFEAVGEIDFSGTQSFFRRLGYDRKSYRFAKADPST